MLALVFGAVLAEEETEMEEISEGRTFLTPFLGLLGPLGTLINIGSQFVILIALIGFVTGLKGVVDFDKLFKKSEEVYDYADTGYLRRGDYGPQVYSGNNYAPNSASYQRLTQQVNEAVEKQF